MIYSRCGLGGWCRVARIESADQISILTLICLVLLVLLALASPTKVDEPSQGYPHYHECSYHPYFLSLATIRASRGVVLRSATSSTFRKRCTLPSTVRLTNPSPCGDRSYRHAFLYPRLMLAPVVAVVKSLGTIVRRP